MPASDIELSVVMPVHNARPYVDSAIESILLQSCADFELVILDDGSTDGSLQRLREWASRDGRIRLIEGGRNLGPVGSSNRLAREAKGRLVARMDADDISHPDRLATQLAILNKRPDIGVLGCLCESIDAQGRRLRGADVWRLTRPSTLAPFPHGSIMYRRELFERLGGYRRQCEFWEDQDLMLRAAKITTVATIPRPLYHYRHSPVSTRLASETDRVERAVDLMYRAMEMLKQRGSYEKLLTGEALVPRPRLDPRVFVSLGSLVLWGGDRPAYFGRLLKRGGLSVNAKSQTALVWTAWAAVEPRSLRWLMTMVAKMRNRATPDQPELVEWTPEQLPVDEKRAIAVAPAYRRPKSFSISE